MISYQKFGNFIEDLKKVDQWMYSNELNCTLEDPE